MRYRVSWLLATVGLVLSAGCGSPDACDHPEVLQRWDVSAVDASPGAPLTIPPVTGPPPGSGQSCDAQWTQCDQFPHPTYKGGTPDAYQCFAQVFIQFFNEDGNFDYLASNHLLGLRLIYKFPDGKLGLDTTFYELANDLSNADYLPGFLPDPVRSQLAAIRDRIQGAM